MKAFRRPTSSRQPAQGRSSRAVVSVIGYTVTLLAVLSGCSNLYPYGNARDPSALVANMSPRELRELPLFYLCQGFRLGNPATSAEFERRGFELSEDEVFALRHGAIIAGTSEEVLVGCFDQTRKPPKDWHGPFEDQIFTQDYWPNAHFPHILVQDGAVVAWWQNQGALRHWLENQCESSGDCLAENEKNTPLLRSFMIETEYLTEEMIVPDRTIIVHTEDGQRLEFYPGTLTADSIEGVDGETVLISDIRFVQGGYDKPGVDFWGRVSRGLADFGND